MELSTVVIQVIPVIKSQISKMASFTNITFAIAMLSLLSSCIHYTNPLVNRGSLANSIWDTFQPKLRRLVDSFEKICMSQNVEFDRVKVVSHILIHILVHLLK